MEAQGLLTTVERFLLFALLVCVDVYVTSIPVCEKDYYLDHGTGHCEHCRDICDNAKIQRTVEACTEKCPDFGETEPGKIINEPAAFPAAAKVGIGAAVVIAVCVLVLAVMVKWGVISKLTKCTPPQPNPAEDHLPFPVVVSEQSDSGISSSQESMDGRCGNQKMALLSDSCSSGFSDDNMEPKTIFESSF